MAQFQVTRAVTFAVEAETEEDAHAQAEQWHGLAAGGQFDALAQMTPSVQVVPAASAAQKPAHYSMSTGI